MTLLVASLARKREDEIETEYLDAEVGAAVMEAVLEASLIDAYLHDPLMGRIPYAGAAPPVRAPPETPRDVIEVSVDVHKNKERDPVTSAQYILHIIFWVTLLLAVLRFIVRSRGYFSSSADEMKATEAAKNALQRTSLIASEMERGSLVPARNFPLTYDPPQGDELTM